MLRSRTARIAATVLVVLIAVPGIIYAAPSLVGADQSLVVLSGSMEPLVSPGDVIFIDETPAAELAVGDVITFRVKPGSKTLITHRIIEVIESEGRYRFRTQGDANEDPDPFMVHENMLVGKYEWHMPYWGLLVKAIKTKMGYVALILLPSSIIIIGEMVKLYRELDAWDRANKAKKAAAAGAGAASASEQPTAAPSVPEPRPTVTFALLGVSKTPSPKPAKEGAP